MNHMFKGSLMQKGFLYHDAINHNSNAQNLENYQHCLHVDISVSSNENSEIT